MAGDALHEEGASRAIGPDDRRNGNGRLREGGEHGGVAGVAVIAPGARCVEGEEEFATPGVDLPGDPVTPAGVALGAGDRAAGTALGPGRKAGYLVVERRRRSGVRGHVTSRAAHGSVSGMAKGRLAGRVAWVTGAARGQGAAEARLFAEEGARVVVCDVLEAELRAVAEEIGDAALAYPLDVSSESQWEACAAEVESRFGGLDVLVNNAGITRAAPLLETTLDDYMAVIGVNQVGCFLGMRVAGGLMARSGGGSIINVASTGGLEGVPQMVAYAASKHAITGMTKTAAIELAPQRIRVNSLHPGGVDTDMIGTPEQRRAVDYGFLPLGRLASPEEIARVALFLASDDSSYCTGTALLADGGSMSGPQNWSPPDGI